MKLRIGLAFALALTTALGAAAPAAAKTVWLCKPGLRDNPCSPSLRTSVLSTGEKKIATLNVKRRQRPRYDCFYVYPTVSNQPGVQATKAIDPELRSIALYQAARYSRDCRVYAPVYRQYHPRRPERLSRQRRGSRARLRGRARGLAHLPATAQQGPRGGPAEPLAGHASCCASWSSVRSTAHPRSAGA